MTAARERINLPAFVAGVVAGLAAFIFLMGAGYLLYQRLFGSGLAQLLAILLVFALVGGYAGWLLGLIVFSALRGPVEGAE